MASAARRQPHLGQVLPIEESGAGASGRGNGPARWGFRSVYQCVYLDTFVGVVVVSMVGLTVHEAGQDKPGPLS